MLPKKVAQLATLAQLAKLAKNGKSWQKFAKVEKGSQKLAKELAKVDKRETLAKKGNVGKSSEKLAKVGKSWQTFAKLAKFVGSCMKLSEVAKCCQNLA